MSVSNCSPVWARLVDTPFIFGLPCGNVPHAWKGTGYSVFVKDGIVFVSVWALDAEKNTSAVCG